MKNNDSLFSDFITLAVMASIEKSFSEKKKAENLQTEKNTAEKTCNCKSQQNITKELLSDITKCEKLLAGIKQKLVSAVE